MVKKLLTTCLLGLALLCATGAQASEPGSLRSAGAASSGSTDQPSSHHIAMSEEFAKCSAFHTITAECAKEGKNEEAQKGAAANEELAVKFYHGSRMMVGSGQATRRVTSQITNQKRRIGETCAKLPELDKQFQAQCARLFKLLPRTLQQKAP